MKLNTTLSLLITGFIFSMLVFGGSIYYTYKTEENLFADFNDVAQTHATLNEVKKITNSLINLETNIRGYELTKDDEFLTTYNRNGEILLADIQKLKADIRGDTINVVKVNKLLLLVKERIEHGRKMMEYAKIKDKNEAFVKDYLETHRALRTKINQVQSEIIGEQEDLLQHHHETVVNKLKKTHLTIEIVGLSALFLSILIIVFFYQYNKTHEKIERDLVELNDNKNKFFSIISHDLRGPVKNIVLMAQLLHDQVNTKSYDPQKIAKMIESSAKNLSALLDNLLKWSRLQMNNIEFQPEKLDLQKVTDDVISNQMVHALQKNIILINVVPSNIFVYVDQNMVSTVLRNLISNGLKFTNKGGTIEISAEKKPENIEISVKDNGVGMPRKIADKIFSIDFKHTTKGTNKEEGTGLGLKLCKEFVEKNGGKIRLESIENVGTTFIFTIPLAKFYS